MILVVLALLPTFFFGTYNVGLQSPEVLDKSFLNCFTYGIKIVLPMYLVVFAAGGLFEALFAVVPGHEINEGFLVTGFLIPLTMPPTVPLWMLAVATIFGVVIGKEIFGGTGYNIFNPALTARVFSIFLILFICLEISLGLLLWMACLKLHLYLLNHLKLTLHIPGQICFWFYSRFYRRNINFSCSIRSWTIINRCRQLENYAFNMYRYGSYITFIKSIIIYFR